MFSEYKKFCGKDCIACCAVFLFIKKIVHAAEFLALSSAVWLKFCFKL